MKVQGNMNDESRVTNDEVRYSIVNIQSLSSEPMKPELFETLHQQFNHLTNQLLI